MHAGSPRATNLSTAVPDKRVAEQPRSPGAQRRSSSFGHLALVPVLAGLVPHAPCSQRPSEPARALEWRWSQGTQTVIFTVRLSGYCCSFVLQSIMVTCALSGGPSRRPSHPARAKTVRRCPPVKTRNRPRCHAVRHSVGRGPTCALSEYSGRSSASRQYHDMRQSGSFQPPDSLHWYAV